MKWILSEDEQFEKCEFCRHFGVEDDTCYRSKWFRRPVDPDQICCDDGYEMDEDTVSDWLDKQPTEEDYKEWKGEEKYEAIKNGDYEDYEDYEDSDDYGYDYDY